MYNTILYLINFSFRDDLFGDHLFLSYFTLLLTIYYIYEGRYYYKKGCIIMRKSLSDTTKTVIGIVIVFLLVLTFASVITVIDRLDIVRISYEEIDKIVCPIEHIRISDITITDMDTNHIESNNLDIYPNSSFFNKYSIGDTIIAEGDLYSKTIGGETYYIMVDTAIYAN